MLLLGTVTIGQCWENENFGSDPSETLASASIFSEICSALASRSFPTLISALYIVNTDIRCYNVVLRSKINF